MSLRASSAGAGTRPRVLSVDAVLERLHDRARRVRGVLDRVAPAGAQRRVGHPAHVGGQRRARGPAGRWGRRCRSPRATSSSSTKRTVTLIGGDGSVERTRRACRSKRSCCALRRQHDDLVAGAQHAAGDLPRVAAVVALAVADDVLHGEAQLGQVAVGLHLRRSRGARAAPGRRTTASPRSARRRCRRAAR